MDRPPGSVVEAAPAKINLALHVVGRRRDGYHDLESLVVFASAADKVTVTSAAVNGFACSGPFSAGLPRDRTNLVLRARDLLPGDGPVAIVLEKHLPIASGIGGGSSDAAATLRALNALWRLQLAPQTLARMAAPLGADVPMCVHARPLVARGFGHDIEPLPSFPALPMVLVNPGVPVPTPDVFRALEQKQNAPLPPLPPLSGSPDIVLDWLHATRNDLQPAAIKLAPAIADALSALRQSNAALARMSGSGATCFGLFETDGAARAAQASIARHQPDWWVVAARSGGAS